MEVGQVAFISFFIISFSFFVSMKGAEEGDYLKCITIVLTFW